MVYQVGALAKFGESSPMWSRRIAVIALCAVFSLISCGGDDKPTAPNAGSKGVYFYCKGWLTNSAWESTAYKIEMLLDGEMLVNQTFQSPSSGGLLVGGKIGVSRGRHTLSFRIVSQSVVTASYCAWGVQVMVNQTDYYDLTETCNELEAGETIDFQLDI